MKSKAELRTDLKARRVEVADRSAASAAAAAAILNHAWFAGAKTIALFAAFGDEADPRGLEVDRSKVLAFPRITGDRLVFHRATREGLVIAKSARFPIPTPSEDAPVVELGSIDLFIVPGLGFTRSGKRIGYGRGHYDRVLAGARAANPAVRAIGFAFEAQLLADADLPTDPHDQRVDAVATEQGLVLV